MLHERACAVGLEEYFYTFPGAGHVPYINNANTMNITVNFIRDFLVKQLGCDVDDIQPPNEWLENAFLYPTDDCDGNPIEDECTSNGLIENTSAIIEIYPNPAKNKLTVRSNELIGQIEIYNLVGQKIMSKKGMLNELSIELNNIKSGSYFIRVFDANNNNSKAQLIEVIQ